MAAPKGNKFAEGNNGGRPPKYNTAEEMQVLIDEYFESCFEDVPQFSKDGTFICNVRMQTRPFTITGLCLALDMDRDSLLNYGKDKEFFGTVARAKLKCHNYAEEHLYNGKNPQGAIFNLKNNYGWKDKTEQEVTVSGGLADELKAARERASK